MAAERKRPWYLVLALLGALALGTAGASGGWFAARIYFVDIDPTVFGDGIANEHDREVVITRAEEFLHSLDVARPRAWPLAVATLILGSATLLFGLRALGGSSGARAALVQLVLAQAGVHVAAHYLLRDPFDKELRLQQAKAAADEHAGGPAEAVPTRAATTASLVLGTLASVLVVVGLTRRGSRAYFEATAAAVEER
jgi:hypothetical protein